MERLKWYAYIRFELSSPLSVSSGKSFTTDKDIIRNAKGQPYIPASAFAGVYRNLFDETEKNRYFGYVKINTGDGSDKTTNQHSAVMHSESPLIVYDGVLLSEKSSEGIRHGVGLDEFRTALEGAKYDFEVVEPGAAFWTALEYTDIADEKESIPPVMQTILSAWDSGGIVVGGKSTRGYGRLKAVELQTVHFRLPEERGKWLAFDLYENRDGMAPWKQPEGVVSPQNRIDICLKLKQESPLTVRVYTTEVARENESVPDYGQLTFKKTEGKQCREIAVIPGTAWAGVFRHSMQRILAGEILKQKKTDRTTAYKEADKKLESLFGCVGGKTEADTRRSTIVFSETQFEGMPEEYLIRSRNAINRFSGGAKDTSLFTERMFLGRKTGELCISLPQSDVVGFRHALAVSIADLHEGFLAVGGEAAIGHGLFSVAGLKINNCEMNIRNEETGKTKGTDIYEFVMECLKGGEQND